MTIQKFTIVSLLLLVAVLLTAQNVSSVQLVGKWKIIAMDTDGLTADFTNSTTLWKSILESVQKKFPDKVKSAADTIHIQKSAKKFNESFGSTSMNFYANNSYTGLLNLTGKVEQIKGKYSISNNVLTLFYESGKERTKITITMPDNNTLVLTDTADKAARILTFKRR